MDCIQDYASVHSLDFKFGRDQVVYQIRIDGNKSYFEVFVNDVATARIELLGEKWLITSGNIDDRELRNEVIKRITANS